MYDVYLSLENVPCKYQSDAVKAIIQPILAKRFKEKLDALELDENFLEGCEVSRPIAKTTNRRDGVSFNTMVGFTFPKDHPVLKNQFHVAYQRATFSEYFEDVIIEEVFFEDLPTDNQAYLAYWSDYFGKLLGAHFKKHGGVTLYNIPRPLRFDKFHGIDMIACLPNRQLVNKQLYDWMNEEKPFEVFPIKLVIQDSYALLDAEITFDIKIVRRDYDPNNKYRYLRDKGDTRFSHL